METKMKNLLCLMIICMFSIKTNATQFMSFDGVNPIIDKEVDVNIGQTFGMYVMSDSSSPYGLYWGSYWGTPWGTNWGNNWDRPSEQVTMNMPVQFANAGHDSSVVDFSAPYYYDYEVKAVELWPWTGQPVIAGAHFYTDFTVIGSVGDKFATQILNFNTYATMEEVVFTIVPEPMTISLLALGGLVLRKQK